MGSAWIEKNLVLTNAKGYFYSVSTLGKVLRRFLVSIGLPHMRFYDVRRFGDCKIALKGQRVRAMTF